MNRKIQALFLILMLAVSLTACGGSSNETTAPATEAASEEVVETGDGEEELEDEEFADDEEIAEDEEDEEVEDIIVVADYDPDQYVKLGEYTGLSTDIMKVEVSEEDIKLQIETDLEDNAEEQDKKDGAEEGDYAVISYTVKVDGKEVEDLAVSDYEIVIGWGDAGEELEAAMIGKKAGDSFDVSMELDETYGEDYEGKTGEFAVKIDRVYSFVSPELTDEYVKEHTEYGSVDEYRKGVEEQILKELTANARQEAGDRLLSQVADASECTGYPDDLYQSVYRSTEEMYTYYAAMFGTEREELISDEDLESSVVSEVNTQMILKAIAKKEGLTLTDEEYQKYLEDNAAEYGFETGKELEEAYGESDLKAEASRDKVTDWLLENNTLTELSQADYEAKYGAEEELDEAEPEDEEDMEEAEGEEEAEPAEAAEEAEGAEDAEDADAAEGAEDADAAEDAENAEDAE